MRKHRSALGGAALALVMTLATAGCTHDDPTADPSPTKSTSATSSPTESATPTSEPETLDQKAARLAEQQVKAYIKAYDRLFADPGLPLSIIDDYARDQALLEIKDSIEKRRDRGERIVGRTKITKTWLGPERVVFNGKAPMAVVDLYICYDLDGAQVIDANGDSQPLVGPDVPQVAQARYAVYADEWPNDDASQWRVGKEYAAGEPCAR